MTDTQVNETPATADVEPKEETKVIPPKESLDVLTGALLKGAEEKYAEIKAVADKQAKVGDVGQLLSEAIASSENPEVVKLRTQREKAAAAINRFDKEMESIVKPTLEIPTDEELAAMDTQYKTLATELNTFNQVFSGEIGKAHPGITLFDYIGDLPGKRKGAKAGQGTGTSRPRVSSVEVTEDKNGEQGYEKVGKDGKSTFSHLALWLKSKTGEVVSASDFHAEWTKQNGVTEWTDLAEVTKFNYSVTDKDSKTHTFWVRVTR